MRKPTLAKLSLLALTLTTVMNSSPAQAQFNDGEIDWGWQTGWQQANGYIGQTPIVLREVSPRLRNAMRAARQEQRKLKGIRQELQPLEQKLERKQKARRDAKKTFDDATAALTRIEGQITKKEKDIADANSNLPSLQTALATAEQRLKTARANKKAADDAHTAAVATQNAAQATLGTKSDEYRAWLQQCAQTTGKPIQQCAGSPEGQQKQQELREARAALTAAQEDTKTKATAKERAASRLTNAQSAKSRAAKAVTDANDLITNGQTQLATLKQNKRTKAQEKRTAKTNLDAVKEEINTINAEIAPVQRRLARQRQVFQDAKQDAMLIRSNLIDRVMSANREGHRIGVRYGSDEGNALAYSLGRDKGTQDGQRAGQSQGTADGQRRDYQKGYANGEVQGQADAESVGEIDGRAVGRSQGNRAAGNIEGTADGEERARRSDASTKGQAAGTAEGRKRAVEDGNRIGTELGEREAISDKESKRLKRTTVKGQFAGIFTQNPPAYPGVQTPSYRDCDSYRREFVRVACRDGLGYGYFVEAEATYNNVISRYYNDAYNAGYRSYYDYYYGQAYPASEEQGYSQGQSDKYAAVYPGVKERFRQIAKDQYTRNPERQSSDYRNSFSSATRAAYDRKYGEIYNAKFAQFNKSVYDQNIGEQTEKYKGIRKAQVVAIYDNHPVIKFEEISISDGGKQGVSILDGVFMPGEDMVTSVVITNYGKAEATNVKIRLDDGSQFTLPTIAGESVVTLQGIAKRAVRGSEGARDVLTASMTKKLWSNEKNIEGRHFYNSASGVLVNNARKDASVMYPVQVTGLGLSKPLLLGEEQSLTINLQKRANRTINGPIEVQLSTNLGSVVSNEFPSISKLSGPKSLSDAKVLVTNEGDALQYLNFSADIVKNGVVIGKISRSGSKLVQIGYKEKEGAAVLLGNAVDAPSDLLDSLSDLGGISNVSVIDLALDQGNLLSSDKLSGKTVVVTQRAPTTQTKAAVSAILRGNDANVITVKDQYAHGAILQASALAQAATETTQMSNVANAVVSVPNLYLDSKVDGSIIVQGLDPEKAEQIGKALTANNNELLEKAKTIFTLESITSTIESETIGTDKKDVVKQIVGKVLAQAMMNSIIEKADSKKGKSIRKAQEKNSSDLAVMLGKAVKQARDDKNKDQIVSLMVVLEEIKVAIADVEQFEDMDRDVRNSIKERFDRDLGRAIDRLSRSEKRKLIGRNGYNKLAGNFQPFVERK